MFSTESAITYLVHKKFGIIATLAPTFEMIQKNKNINAEKSIQTINIESYEKSLRALPVSELEKKYHQAIASEADRARQYAINEEKSWCYNLQSANADFVHWAKAAPWTLDEAIALSFGKEPEIVTWKKIETLKHKSEFAKAFAKRRDLAIRATRIKKLSDPVMPVVFICWAKELHIELPSILLTELEKVGNAAIDWRKEWLKLKASCDSMQKQAPENTQQTENLLQAIACMAMDGYGFKLEDKKSVVHTEISNALKRHEKAIDRKTIKAWIDKGISLLPRKPL